MSDRPNAPRYVLRQKTEKGTQVRERARLTDTPSSQLDLPSEIRPPAEDVESLTDSFTIPTTVVLPATPTSSETPTPTANLPAQTRPQSLLPVDVRSKLTINGRTFFGPLPRPQQHEDSNNSSFPASHAPYALFTCPNCPLEDVEHALCLPTHPCIWSFPPKAREAYANRNHWYTLGKTLEETKILGKRFPKLVDETGEFMTRALDGVETGMDMDEAWNQVVRRRWRALVNPEHLREGDEDEEDEDEEGRELKRGMYRRAREEMLESMEWRFDW